MVVVTSPSSVSHRAVMMRSSLKSHHCTGCYKGSLPGSTNQASRLRTMLLARVPRAMAAPQQPPISCLQLNMHHSKAATANLLPTLCGGRIDIALLQEPWQHGGRVRGLSIQTHTTYSLNSHVKVRTCVLINKKIDAILLSQFSSSDLTSVRIRLDGDSSEGVVVASAYLPHDEDSPPQHKNTRAGDLLYREPHSAYHRG